jgi:hypothetical protein
VPEFAGELLGIPADMECPSSGSTPIVHSSDPAFCNLVLLAIVVAEMAFDFEDHR